MPRHLSTYVRERTVALWEEGKPISENLKTLESKGRRTSRTTVRRWVFRWRTNRGLRDQHRSGRRSRITLETDAFIERSLHEDNEITSAELQRLLFRKFSINISAPIIRRYIRTHLKQIVVHTRFGPMISEKNKAKRSKFAQICLDTKDTFENVIWTDESSVQLTHHSQTMRVKIGKERVLKPAPKHAVKVRVWAGISKRGATNICIFDQIMDGVLYTQILDKHLLPFLEEKFQGTEYRFMQDNDPKHTSRVAKHFYQEKGINW